MKIYRYETMFKKGELRWKTCFSREDNAEGWHLTGHLHMHTYMYVEIAGLWLFLCVRLVVICVSKLGLAILIVAL